MRLAILHTLQNKVKCSPPGLFHLNFPRRPSLVGDREAALVRLVRGGGSSPYRLTFGMETHENDARFRRWGSVSGIIDRSAVNNPPP
ncbi:protein of unknown function [Methanoculleus bourgensis]|uniref:Uncharacterized protein n=1 Tax=Methanoculleus bourgensis TaxID=83986 RepID=A0A0X3BJ30_9EURY|nr:protein of unknown function [Methanoculleus bourgensis]